MNKYVLEALKELQITPEEYKQIIILGGRKAGVKTALKNLNSPHLGQYLVNISITNGSSLVLMLYKDLNFSYINKNLKIVGLSSST